MKRIFTALVFAALFSGCTPMDDYNVVIKNVGGKTIDDAHVLYGEFRSVGGILPPDIWSKHMLPDHPIPEKAMVEWRTEDGVMHREEVEVLKHIPKGFRGDIQFEIDDDNSVTVRVIPEKPGSD